MDIDAVEAAARKQALSSNRNAAVSDAYTILALIARLRDAEEVIDFPPVKWRAQAYRARYPKAE